MEISFPIKMLKAQEEGAQETTIEYETINKATALWTLPKGFSRKMTDTSVKSTQYDRHIGQ